jgi:hypothetical protein
MTAIAEIETTDTASLRAIARRRRELQESVQDAKEDLATQRQKISAFSARLIDAKDDDSEEQLPPARRHLKQLADALEEAESALATFNESNPTEEQVAARETALALEAEQTEQKKMRDLFRENMRRRIQLLTELGDLETSAASMCTSALTRWPRPQPGLLKGAGIDSTMLNFISETYWNLKTVRPPTRGLWESNGRPWIQPGSYLGQALEAAQSFDPDLIAPDGTLAPAPGIDG